MPEYWQTTGIWLAQTPAFLIGGYIMSRIIKGVKLNWVAIAIIFILTVCMVVMASYFKFGIPFSRIAVRFCGLVVLCCLMNVLSSYQYDWVLRPLKWFGKYSLEIYVLHLLLYQPFKNLGYNSLYLIIMSIGLAVLLCRPVHIITEKIRNKWE